MDRRRREPGSGPAARTLPGDPDPILDPGQPTVYQVRIRGHLDDRWADWHEALSFTREESGDTVLTCRVADQAALHGLLRKLRDLGAPLVSINPTGLAQPGSASSEENR